MDDIHYDILESIISNLNLKDTIHFLFASNKIYKVYKDYDENYGCNKISNKIIRESLKFFNINNQGNDKASTVRICNDLIKIYNVFKNNKHFNNFDVLVYMIEYQMYSNELFDKFCSTCNYVLPMTEIDIQPYNCIKDIANLGSQNFYFREYKKNIISKTDMNYMLLYADNNKIDILLKHFPIKSSEISYCIRILLKDRQGIFTDCNNFIIKIKKFIDYIFMKYLLKDMSSIDKLYFNTIYAHLLLYNKKILIDHFFFKVCKYKSKEIFNENLIINIMSNNYDYDYNYNYNYNAFFNLKK